MNSIKFSIAKTTAFHFYQNCDQSIILIDLNNTDIQNAEKRNFLVLLASDEKSTEINNVKKSYSSKLNFLRNVTYHV